MSDDQYSLGFQYDMSLKLTQLIPRDEQGKPSVNEKVYLDKIDVSYIDSGPIDVDLENRRTGAVQGRTIRSDYGTTIGEIPIGTTLDTSRVYTETGRRQVFTRGRSEDIELSISSSTHLGTRIAAVSQTGTIIPQV